MIHFDVLLSFGLEFPSRFTANTSSDFSSLSCYVFCPTYPLWFNHLSNILLSKGLQTMALSLCTFSTLSLRPVSEVQIFFCCLKTPLILAIPIGDGTKFHIHTKENIKFHFVCLMCSCFRSQLFLHCSMRGHTLQFVRIWLRCFTKVSCTAILSGLFRLTVFDMHSTMFRSVCVWLPIHVISLKMYFLYSSVLDYNILVFLILSKPTPGILKCFMFHVFVIQGLLTTNKIRFSGKCRYVLVCVLHFPKCSSCKIVVLR
jgi:hypothetical protein